MQWIGDPWNITYLPWTLHDTESLSVLRKPEESIPSEDMSELCTRLENVLDSPAIIRAPTSPANMSQNKVIPWVKIVFLDNVKPWVLKVCKEK